MIEFVSGNGLICRAGAAGAGDECAPGGENSTDEVWMNSSGKSTWLGPDSCPEKGNRVGSGAIADFVGAAGKREDHAGARNCRADDGPISSQSAR